MNKIDTIQNETTCTNTTGKPIAVETDHTKVLKQGMIMFCELKLKPKVLTHSLAEVSLC